MARRLGAAGSRTQVPASTRAFWKYANEGYWRVAAWVAGDPRKNCLRCSSLRECGQSSRTRIMASVLAKAGHTALSIPTKQRSACRPANRRAAPPLVSGDQTNFLFERDIPNPRKKHRDFTLCGPKSTLASARILWSREARGLQLPEVPSVRTSPKLIGWLD